MTDRPENDRAEDLQERKISEALETARQYAEEARQYAEIAQQHEEAARQHEEAARQHEEAVQRAYQDQEGYGEAVQESRSYDVAQGEALAGGTGAAAIDPDEPWPVLNENEGDDEEYSGLR